MVATAPFEPITERSRIAPKGFDKLSPNGRL